MEYLLARFNLNQKDGFDFTTTRNYISNIKWL